MAQRASWQSPHGWGFGLHGRELSPQLIFDPCNFRDNLLSIHGSQRPGSPLAGLRIMDVGCGGGLLSEVTNMLLLLCVCVCVCVCVSVQCFVCQRKDKKISGKNNKTHHFISSSFCDFKLSHQTFYCTICWILFGLRVQTYLFDLGWGTWWHSWEGKACHVYLILHVTGLVTVWWKRQLDVCLVSSCSVRH